MATFYPLGAKIAELILIKLGMVDYVWTPPHMTTLVGVAQRGWSGQTCDLWHLWVSFLSFFFFAFFNARPGRISWPIGAIYTPKRVFSAKDVPFGGIDNIRLHFVVKPSKISPILAGIGFSQPNRRNSKTAIAIYRSPMKVFASDFTNRLITGALSKNVKLCQRGSWRGNVTYF